MSAAGPTARRRRLPDVIRGRIAVVGDHVDTEQLLSASLADCPLIIGGKNFGWGTSPQEACDALRQAGAQAVIAEGFAQSFQRIAADDGSRLILCETQQERLCETIQTGMEGELVLANPTRPVLYVATLKTSWTLGSLEEALPTR